MSVCFVSIGLRRYECRRIFLFYREEDKVEWLYLGIAGAMEVLWSTFLKFSEGFTKPMPTVITLAGLAASMFFLAKAAKERNEHALVRRLHRLTAEDRKPRDIRGLERRKDLVFDLTVEELTIVEVPLVGIEAPLAMMGATRNEEGDPDTLSVRDIAGSDGREVHET